MRKKSLKFIGVLYLYSYHFISLNTLLVSFQYK